MAELPGWMLTHTILVEPFLGSSGNGPAFGKPLEVRCHLEPERSTQRGTEQRVDTTPATIYCQLGEPVTPESRVTVAGRRVQVVSVVRHDGGGLPTPDHLEVKVR